MRCDKCLKKDYCIHIHHFNHDPSVACIEFIDRESPTYISTTTLDSILFYQGIPVDDSLKAIEIIKEKGINVFELRYSFSLAEYNICKGTENKELTQEEYDLLKEVLKSYE